MGLSPVSLKSLLPSFPPWRRDPSSQSVWSLHTLLYRTKWALIDWICLHANEVQNGTNQKDVLNLERDWEDRWASPKCASFPTMMVVGIISYHKDVARQIAYRKSLGFFFFFWLLWWQSNHLGTQSCCSDLSLELSHWCQHQAPMDDCRKGTSIFDHWSIACFWSHLAWGFSH